MKLHLGCGKRYIPGYVHVDAVDYPHVDQVSSIDNAGVDDFSQAYIPHRDKERGVLISLNVECTRPAV